MERVADGRVFTGRQVLALSSSTRLGDEKAAIAWLAKAKNIDPKTPVRDYRLHDRLSDLPFLHTAVIAMLEAVGLAHSRAASKIGVRCRRWSDSTLTVCWRFGTLSSRISGWSHPARKRHHR